MHATLPSREALAELCRRHSVEQLYLFGSATGRRFDGSMSDLDFLVSFQEQSPRQYAENYLSLADTLEKVCGRPVDLVTEPSIRNRHFRETVFATRQLLYERQHEEAVA